MTKIIYSFLTVFLLFISFGNSFAETLKVGTIEREPFSYQDSTGEWLGFSIDLWKNIADDNKLDYEFVSYTSFSEMIEDTKNKKNDLSVANISITAEREKVMDFSSPIYDSGLNIGTLSDNSEVFLFYSNYADFILTGLKIVGVLLLIITHYFFIFNVIRGNISFFSYPKEIFLVCGEVLGQIKQVLGTKIVFPIVLIIGIFMISLVSQKFTFMLNDIDEQQINPTTIISYKDLDIFKVGTTNGSVGKTFLEKKGIPVEGYPLLSEIYTELLEQNLDYIVTDEPILRYKAKNDPRFKVTGKSFNKDKYALLFPEYENKQNAILIKKINVSILQMREDERYDLLYNKYFK